MIKLVLFLPLISGIIIGLFNKRLPHKLSGWISSIIMAYVAILGIILFQHQLYFDTPTHLILTKWIYIDNLQIDWAIYLDRLSALMVVVVTVISAIVHFYSIGYMEHDHNLPRFMSYLSLFTFFMLMLVLSDNFLQLFFGWEGVGLCSYLLIGFWYHKDSACYASVKAFIVNRVGDFSFLIGIFLIYYFWGTLKFSEVFAIAPQISNLKMQIFSCELSVIEVSCMFLFIGCMGKSAQIGLHTWLPDAMEGPTPVSALIHAATMVTAGVFLLVRCSPLYGLAIHTLHFVTIIGAITCLFAATIAIAQNDIKKVIAYSTCSQLGYMFFACGVSSYEAGMFHLFTHAFFKALLFLCAGNVIHAMSDEQDISKMGGLYRKIPFTYVLFVIATIAIIGIYPLAGYYSKDAILESAYMSDSLWGKFAYKMGIIAAFCTAFYSIRLLILVFHGQARYSEAIAKKIHESPYVMTLPLAVLALGSIFAGMWGEHIGMISAEAGYFGASIHNLSDILAELDRVPILVKYMPMIVSAIAIFLAYVIFINLSVASKLVNMFSFIRKLFSNKYYVDEIYDILFVRALRLKAYCAFWIDRNIIDLLGPRGIANSCSHCARIISSLQSGYIFNYVFIGFASGVILMSLLINQYFIKLW